VNSPEENPRGIPRWVRRFSTLLRQRIRSAGRTQRQVERELGWSSGYISQLLRGNQDLKLKHALAILDAVGAEPGAWLRDLAAASREDPSSAELPGPAPPASTATPAELADLRERLQPYVQEMVLATLRKQP